MATGQYTRSSSRWNTQRFPIGFRTMYCLYSSIFIVIVIIIISISIVFSLNSILSCQRTHPIIIPLSSSLYLSISTIYPLRYGQIGSISSGEIFLFGCLQDIPTEWTSPFARYRRRFPIGGNYYETWSVGREGCPSLCWDIYFHSIELSENLIANESYPPWWSFLLEYTITTTTTNYNY